MIITTLRSAAPRPFTLAALALLAVLLSAGAARAQWTNTSPNISNTNTGNVGIGTANPLVKLSFAQGGIRPWNAHSGGLEITNTAGGGVAVFMNNTFGDYALFNVLRPGGNVDAGDFQIYALGPTYLSTGLFSAGSVVLSARSNYTAGLSLWSEAGPLKLYTGSYSSPARLTVDTAGNVGIGGAAPAGKRLYVAGDVEVAGNIAAKYQDVAEWVPSTQRLAPGTVVSLDPARPNHVLACATAYDTAVAGVVSGQPGIILGEAGEGKVMVATTGRVRVKVDASRGPIRIGDLLVTSGTSGVAMRSEAVSLGGVKIHRPGTIIGKALEPLEKGAGEILVLLSMQ